MARDARKYHGLTLMGTFVAGAFFDAFVMRLGCTRTEASPVSISGKTIVLEERGPPTKQELGQAGWTLLHTMAANYPDQPTAAQRARIEAFLHALGHLYPCPDCAAHFRLHMKAHPVVSATREGLSRWMCDAHNEVNSRNGKDTFYCDVGVLDARWKDCGCEHGNVSVAAGAARGAHQELSQQHQHAFSPPPGRGFRRRLH